VAHSDPLPYGLTCDRIHESVKTSVISRSVHVSRFNSRNGRSLLVEIYVLFLEGSSPQRSKCVLWFEERVVGSIREGCSSC
jgi:hypothetical protein